MSIVIGLVMCGVVAVHAHDSECYKVVCEPNDLQVDVCNFILSWVNPTMLECDSRAGMCPLRNTFWLSPTANATFTTDGVCSVAHLSVSTTLNMDMLQFAVVFVFMLCGSVIVLLFKKPSS